MSNGCYNLSFRAKSRMERLLGSRDIDGRAGRLSEREVSESNLLLLIRFSLT